MSQSRGHDRPAQLLDTLSSQQAAEGDEVLSRREIYRRTKGYSIYGVVNVKIFSAAGILMVVALGLKNPQLILDSDMLCIFAIFGAIVLFWILRYWKHWLDIFKKDLILFEGEVFSEGAVPGSNVESPWENWRLTEKGTDTPRHFVICLRQMKKQYQNNALIPDMCRGPVSFFYLRRTKCIVDIVSISTPEQDNRSKHAQKKARRKAQHQ